MAEWLRRLTRNQMGSSRVGSNPTRSGEFSKLLALYRSRLDENDHDGIRTHNLLIRSQTPYPLGHATDGHQRKVRSTGIHGANNETQQYIMPNFRGTSAAMAEWLRR